MSPRAPCHRPKGSARDSAELGAELARQLRQHDARVDGVAVRVASASNRVQNVSSSSSPRSMHAHALLSELVELMRWSKPAARS